MKHILFLLAISIIAIGCKSTGTIVRYKSGAQKVVVVNDNPATYVYSGSGAPGDQNGTVKAKPGDTLLAYATIKHGGYYTQRSHYLVVSGSDSVWVKNPAVATPEGYAARLTIGTAKVSKAESEEAWSRANEWISKNSDMKMQTATEYVIETFNPTKKGDCGFRATRSIKGDVVSIDIDCLFINDPLSVADDPRLAKECAGAYYVQTGDRVVYTEVPVWND